LVAKKAFKVGNFLHRQNCKSREILSKNIKMFTEISQSFADIKIPSSIKEKKDRYKSGPFCDLLTLLNIFLTIMQMRGSEKKKKPDIPVRSRVLMISTPL
jgi:hypothetical protein